MLLEDGGQLSCLKYTLLPARLFVNAAGCFRAPSFMRCHLCCAVVLLVLQLPLNDASSCKPSTDTQLVALTNTLIHQAGL